MMSVFKNDVNFWRVVSVLLVVLIFAQYVYYSIQQMMYEESMHALYRKTEQLDKIRLDVLLLEERVGELRRNDVQLIERIDANRLAIERQVDMVEQRLPPIKVVKRVH